MTEVTIDSLDKYVQEVESLSEQWDTNYSTTHVWYRGQTDAKWGLIPGLYRGRVRNIYLRKGVRHLSLRCC